MKYLEPSFSTFAVGSDQYRDNWDAIFAKKEEPTEEAAVRAAEERVIADSSPVPDTWVLSIIDNKAGGTISTIDLIHEVEPTEEQRIAQAEVCAAAGKYDDVTPDLEEENKILWDVVKAYGRYAREATEENAYLLAESKILMKKRLGNKYQQKYFANTPTPPGSSVD